MSTLAVNAVTDANGGNTATINSMTPTADSLQGFRNRIINGDMRIDQRNAGASVTQTVAAVYTLDRWQMFGDVTSKFSVQQSSTAPANFNNSLLVTSLSAYTLGTDDRFFVRHKIEGFNVSDLGFGTANAKTVTVSFWVRSSLTGTFGGSLQNGAGDRSYPFTYSISSADIWEYKTVTVAGDTSGTWLTTNGIGLVVNYGLGVQGSTYAGTAGSWNSNNSYSATGGTSVVGTNGATWYITGVQLEVGSVATPFERRPFGTELALCQRYYYKLSSNDGIFGVGYNSSTTASQVITFFPTQMRTAPTALEQSGTANHYRVRHLATLTDCSSVPTFFVATDCTAWSTATVASGLTAGQGSFLRSNSASAYLAWSAEL
jgi:hypothetical protein